MPTTTVRFTNTRGVELAGKLDAPEGVPAAAALFAHCFTCSKDSLAAGRVSKALTDHGIAVLRFDFTGLGESEGAFHETTFASNTDDLRAACDFMAREHTPVGLMIGHSLGGAAVLHAAGSVPTVRAVATIGAPADPAHVRHLFAPGIERIEAEGKAEVSIGGRPFTIGRGFVEDLGTHDPERAVGGLGKPLLIFHSPVDTTVGIDNAAQLYAWAKHPKSFVSLDRADHLLNDRRDAAFVADMIGAWSRRTVIEG